MTIPTIEQWAADCDAALSAYPNDPAKRRKVLESYFDADRRALLAENEELIVAMARAVCEAADQDPDEIVNFAEPRWLAHQEYVRDLWRSLSNYISVLCD